MLGAGARAARRACGATPAPSGASFLAGVVAAVWFAAAAIASPCAFCCNEPLAGQPEGGAHCRTLHVVPWSLQSGAGVAAAPNSLGSSLPPLLRRWHT